MIKFAEHAWPSGKRQDLNSYRNINKQLMSPSKTYVVLIDFLA